MARGVFGFISGVTNLDFSVVKRIRFSVVVDFLATVISELGVLRNLDMLIKDFEHVLRDAELNFVTNRVFTIAVITVFKNVGVRMQIQVQDSVIVTVRGSDYRKTIFINSLVLTFHANFHFYLKGITIFIQAV